MKIEIIKPFRLLEVGRQLDTDFEFATGLIKKGFAKSLEPSVVVDVQEDQAPEAPKKATKAKKQ